MSIKISKLPKVSGASQGDALVIVQNGITKQISRKDFLESLQSQIKIVTSNLSSLQNKVTKTSLDKTNPRLAKPLSVKNPIQPLHAATKNYVDTQVLHHIKLDGSSKIEAPLLYNGDFVFKDKNLITKEYADSLLDVTLKTVKPLSGTSYPVASAGDVFIAQDEYMSFASQEAGGARSEGVDLQKGDILICISSSSGGGHATVGHQFAIINTNVIKATEEESGIMRFSSDQDIVELVSDDSAITPRKYKNALLATSLCNRTLIDRTTYSVIEEDRGVIAVDNRRASSTITLPAVGGLKFPEMFKVTIKDEYGQAALRHITIDANGATIDGKANILLNNNYQAVTIYNDGKNYYIQNNTHVPGDISSGLFINALSVYPSAVDTLVNLKSFDIDLSQFDINEGFKVEASGFFAANGNTKTITLYLDGNATVTNATTTAPNNDHFILTATVIRMAKYESISGALFLEGIAADTYTSISTNLGDVWKDTISVYIGANAASATTDIRLDTLIITPLKQ